MPLFFASLFDIDQYASFVKRRYSLECVHCKKIGHLIAHGNVYKQVSMVKSDVVGKRFVCCKRFGHQGCGRTVHMRLSCQLPRRIYSGVALGVFILGLLASLSVVKAYIHATGQSSSRHAWRWLASLKSNVWCYRSKVNHHANTPHLSPLLDVLTRCLPTAPAAVCLNFQLSHQMPFI